MRYLSVEDETAELTHVIDVPTRDFYAETQVSDETFAIWLKQYDYDPTPLEATIEAREEFEEWKRETIHFDAAYGDERMMAHLFLPRAGPSPFPTIVHFPGSNAIHSESSADLDGHRFGFLLKSGYAVMIPIYKGTYERGDDLTSDYADETNFYKDHVIMWSKDLSRSIDYLETRDDLDLEQLAFYGVSWGGALGAILPAIEKRIKLNVLYVAGLMFQRALPDVDQFHYVSRVTVPTVMINGEFDFFFPVETSQKPFYDLLGTPVEHKRYVVYPGSHAVPRRELIKEVLAWLDRYSKPS